MLTTADVTWLTRKDVAQRIGVSKKTVATWASKGTGPRYARFGRHTRYRLGDVIAWENAHMTQLSA